MVRPRAPDGGEALGKNLKMKAARAAKGMTQQDLAAAVGVTRQTIVAIERGDYNPNTGCFGPETKNFTHELEATI